MAQVLETLLAQLDADTRPMRRALQQAEGDLSAYERNVDKYLSRSEKRFEKSGTFIARQMRAAGLALAAAFTVGAAANAVKDTGSLQGLADMAGLTTDRFQELKAAFTGAGVSQEDFGRGLAEFARHVAEVKNQSGEYYEFLRTSLPSLLDQIKAAQSQSQAIEVVADAMRRLDTDTSRVLLSQKSFGDAGAAWVTVLKGGALALGEATDKARAHGLVLSGANVEAAKKATTAYRELTDQLDVEFKRALTTVVPIATNLFQILNDAIVKAKGEVNAIGEALDRWQQTRDKNSAIVNPRDAVQLKVVEEALRTVEERLKGVYAIQDKLAAGQPLSWSEWFRDISPETVERLERQLLKLVARKNQLLAQPVTTKAWDTTVTDLTMRAKPDYTGADAIARAAKSRSDAEQEAFLSIRHSFEQELEEYRRLHEERRITDVEYARIRADVEATASARVLEAIKKERDAIAQQFQPFRDVIEQSLTDPLRDAFDGNLKSMSNYFHALASNMAIAIQKALVLKPLMDGITNSLAGPGGPVGLLNAIGLKGFGQSNLELGQINGWDTSVAFGGFRAAGGPVAAGMGYTVGEHGVERFVPSVPGYIVPSRTSDGNSVVNIAVDARGSDISVAERTERAVAAAARNMQDPVQAQRAVAKRFPYRK